MLQDEFLNARGAIARFERGSIEIRVLDVQECPRADLAIACLVVGVLELLAAERFCPLAEQRRWAVPPLARLLKRTLVEAEATRIEDTDYLAVFGLTDRDSVSAGELWCHLAACVAAETRGTDDAGLLETATQILEHGTLAGRIRRALGGSGTAEVPRSTLEAAYRQLADDLEAGTLFGTALSL